MFRLQHERKISACAPLAFSVTHCEKMVVTDMSFHQRAATEFLVIEGNSAAVMYERLRGVYGDVFMGASSVRWVKHFKDGNTDIADQRRYGRSRGMHTDRRFGKRGKRSVQFATFRRSINFVVRFVKNVRRRKLSSFNMTTRGLTLHV
jgi:hypothetical protein